MELHPALGVYGFPKSGNTWIQGVFAELGRQVTPRYQQDDIHINRKRNTQFAVHPVVKLSGGPCIVFKSHESYDEMTSEFEDAADLGISHLEKVILVKRNPFDMLLSYINHALWAMKKSHDADEAPPQGIQLYVRTVLGLSGRKTLKIAEEAEILASVRKIGACDAALKTFSENGFSVNPFGSWFGHITSWEQQSKYEVLVLRYEDLVNDLPAQLKRLSAYINVPSDSLSKAFGKREVATSNVRSRDANSRQASFYNKCEAGYFWDYFSVPLLHEIRRAHKNELDSAGYADLLEICPPPAMPARASVFGFRIPFLQSR